MNRNKNKSNQGKRNNNVDVDRIMNWVKSNIFFESDKYTANPEALDQISKTRNTNIKDPLVMLYELVQYIDDLKAEIVEYKDELQNSRSWWDRIFGTKDKELNDLKYEQQKLESKITDLSSELEKVTTERDKYKFLCDDYDERFQRLLGEKSQERLNKNKLYIMNDSRPIDFQIDDDFEKLGKNFYGTSNQIYSHVKSEYILSDDRSQTIANISVIFSKRILLEYWQSLNTQQNLQEEDTDETITNITDLIFRDLGIDSNSLAINEISTKVGKLVKTGRDLLRKICQTDPPGEIFEIEVKEEKIQFNSDEHQAMTSCKPEGKIKFTVFPGYKVNDFIHKVPIVFTVADEELEH